MFDSKLYTPISYRWHLRKLYQLKKKHAHVNELKRCDGSKILIDIHPKRSILKIFRMINFHWKCLKWISECSRFVNRDTDCVQSFWRGIHVHQLFFFIFTVISYDMNVTIGFIVCPFFAWAVNRVFNFFFDWIETRVNFFIVMLRVCWRSGCEVEASRQTGFIQSSVEQRLCHTHAERISLHSSEAFFLIFIHSFNWILNWIES